MELADAIGTVTIVTYSTDRGPALTARLRSMGYTDVCCYADGIQDWMDHGLPGEAD